MLDMEQEVSIVHDLESNGLLTDSTVDYTASPWKLRDGYKMHVIAVLEEETNQLIAFYDGDKIALDGRRHSVDVGGYEVVLENYTALEYMHFPLHKFPDYVKKRKIKKSTGHNVINFDLLAYKIYFGLDFTVGEEGDTWAGKPTYHNDTLVKSKTLNPDRYEHNLDYLSRQAGGAKKVDFRPNVPKELKFEVFGADMLYYNLFDLLSTQSVDKYLDKEAGTHAWAEAIQLEKCVMNLVTQQSHRGFAFDLKLAEENIKELDALMAERMERVSPVLPPKKATKTFMKDFTPPKLQFKKDGSLSGNMEKFIAKIGATIKDNDTIVFEGKDFKLPLEEGVSLITEVPASINDTTHIKEWLVSLGWNPSEYKEKDLSVNTKKQKLTEQEYGAAVLRYVDQTLNSSLCNDRCDYLECTPKTLERTLLGKNLKRGVRVQTNPSFTKGQDKEMCPDLERISASFPFAKDVVEYLTYKHRRNSILGGGLDWEEGEEAEKGYMASVRQDGRIPTPADTCGAACVHPSTLVVTDKGSVPVVEVNVGDLVLTHTGTYKKVVAKVNNGIKPILRLTASSGIQLLCTENHPLLTLEGWKRADALKTGDQVFSYTGKEDWAQVQGLSNYYISSWGRVMTGFGNMVGLLPRKALWDRANIDVIADDGKKHRYGVGGLVLQAFVSQREEGMECCHVDGNPCNNHVKNLKWGTSAENSADARVHGRALKSSRDRAPKLSREQVNEIKEYFLHFGHKRGDDTQLAKQYAVSREHIRDIRTGKRWSDAITEENDYVESFDLVTITCITEEGISPTYDITVEEDHSYIADGFVTHNTSRMKHRITANIPRVTSLYGVKMRALFMADPKECYQIGYDFASLEARIESHYCLPYEKPTAAGAREYCDSLLLEKPNDVHSVLSRKIAGIIGRDFARSPAKNVKYGATYGAQAKKVAKTIGSDLLTGEIVFDAFWEAAAPLKSLKDALQKHWEKNDKKHIITIDGRKVPTRAAHAILNSLFQSAGVICAKRAMVRWETLMREEGLWVDFWSDDWKAKSFAMQMIAYHDEAQIEVTKDLVKFKRFATKEECQAFRKEQREETGLIWSEEHESPKGGWFVAYSKPGELVVRAVEETTKYYKLRVPLSADYVVGASWADCH